VYEKVRLDAGYRIDLLVEGQVVLEIKSVAAIAPIHKAQLMTYLKLSQLKLGLLLNFNVADMKTGITRIVM
jgi:GxxExxY protein